MRSGHQNEGIYKDSKIVPQSKAKLTWLEVDTPLHLSTLSFKN